MAGWRPPDFTAEEFCRVLIRLGFEKKGKARHGTKFYHPKRKSTGKMPFMMVPNSLRNDRNFRKALIRDLIKFWDISVQEIIEAFK